MQRLPWEFFAALSYLGGADEKRKTFDDFKGLAKARPYSAAAISIFLLSMAGIPPTAGFMGKFYIITSAISAGHVALAVLGIVSSIISMWYYLRLIEGRRKSLSQRLYCRPLSRVSDGICRQPPFIAFSGGKPPPDDTGCHQQRTLGDSRSQPCHASRQVGAAEQLHPPENLSDPLAVPGGCAPCRVRQTPAATLAQPSPHC
jgi:hypothetical protein